MAHLIPQTLDTNAPMSEQLVFEAFKQLPDSFTVMSDVPVGLFGRPQADLRQIDFLILHQQMGILVVEVKGGGIKTEFGTWWTQPRGSSSWNELSRSPFKQAADQRYVLQRFLSEKLKINRTSFAHAVALPGALVSGDLGPDAPREQILDIEDLKDPLEALRRVRQSWGTCGPISPDLIDKASSLLRPSFTLEVVTAAGAAETGIALERETRRQSFMVESQVASYRELLSSDRVVVVGGAGTGKTVIAAKLGAQMSTTSARTLIMCHRPGVQSFLCTQLGMKSTQRQFDAKSNDSLQVTSWPRLANAIARDTDRQSVNALTPDLSEVFLEYRDFLSSTFDVLIIDEGQEFTEEQVEALTWLMSEPATSPLYIFADPFQHSGIFSTPTRDRIEKNITYRWAPPKGFQTVMLTSNCRNSNQVSELSSRFYPGPAPKPNVDGPAPIFRRAQKNSVVFEAMKLISLLIRVDGFRSNQILLVVIGIHSTSIERAAGKAGITLVAIDKLFRFPLTSRDLRVMWGRPDDVQGLEADVVVVAYAHDASQSVTAREMYIASSRCKSSLYIVSDLSEESIRSLGVPSEMQLEMEAAEG
ncbi:nuclease-related domain-containing DEAD/DEAH box helicase [Rhodococcoides fascians]|uniref:nuclease-related domain-containing DEAD/DEAH box helicase n=1 Tax=Rhodococcoides fascians TaxID=1828 RepID=UPI0007AAD294|nr:nuclease-related domain-containing protein [Rhodococcus fascians]AMY54769.1 hypothetical protein A3L23_03444 [Rhodococcus fascians D188]